MGKFFSVDNMLFRFMGRVSDLIILNFLWIFSSLPLFTIGASTKALYSVSLNLANESEGSIIKDYFKAFKDNFKKSTILWLIILASSLVLAINSIFWPRFQSALGYFAMIVIAFFIIIFLLVIPYVFPTISKADISIIKSLKLSFLLSMKHLPYSLIISLLGILFIAMNLIYPFSIFFTIFVGISLYCYLSSYIFNMIFNKYPSNNSNFNSI
jgi:uncharacterized membrane protein YesL